MVTPQTAGSSLAPWLDSDAAGDQISITLYTVEDRRMRFGLYGKPVTHRRDMRSTTPLMGLSMMTTISIDDPNHRQSQKEGGPYYVFVFGIR